MRSSGTFAAYFGVQQANNSDETRSDVRECATELICHAFVTAFPKADTYPGQPLCAAPRRRTTCQTLPWSVIRTSYIPSTREATDLYLSGQIALARLITIQSLRKISISRWLFIWIRPCVYFGVRQRICQTRNFNIQMPSNNYCGRNGPIGARHQHAAACACHSPL